jgi:hypothetical protein
MTSETWNCYMCERKYPAIWSACLKNGQRFCSGSCVMDFVQRKRLIVKIKELYTHSIVNEDWTVPELRQRLCALKIEKKY